MPLSAGPSHWLPTCYLFTYFEKIILCSPDWPGTNSVNQVGLKVRVLPASASLGLNVWTHNRPKTSFLEWETAFYLLLYNFRYTMMLYPSSIYPVQASSAGDVEVSLVLSRKQSSKYQYAIARGRHAQQATWWLPGRAAGRMCWGLLRFLLPNWTGLNIQPWSLAQRNNCIFRVFSGVRRNIWCVGLFLQG